MNIVAMVVSLSLSGSVMLVLYLAAKRTLRRYLPAAGLYALLLVVMLRLLVPYAWDFSLMNRLPFDAVVGGGSASAAEQATHEPRPTAAVSSAAEQEVPAQENGAAEGLPSDEAAGTADAVEAASEGAQLSTSFPPGFLLLAVWVTGACLSFGIRAAVYWDYRERILAAAEPSERHAALLDEVANGRRRPTVRLSCEADTPMVLGLFRPHIVLPTADYSGDELTYILRHEYCHYRRRDVAVKWLAAAVCSLHWFNPLMPLFGRELEEACEFACDEAVTRRMPAAERRAYIRTLLKTAAMQTERRSMPLTTMGGGAKRLHERFAAIDEGKRLTAKRMAGSAAFVALALAVGMALGACTGRQNRSDALPTEAVQLSPSPNELPEYDGFAYEVRSGQDKAGDIVTTEGVSHNRVLTRSLFRLLYWERYESIGMTEDGVPWDAAGLWLNFDDELQMYLVKGGDLFVWPDGLYQDDIVLKERYPDFDTSDTSEAAVFGQKVSIFRVPSDLYSKAISLLAPLEEKGAEVYGEEGFEGVVAENGRHYAFSDIGDEWVSSIFMERIRVISSAFGCDFLAEVGSDAYDAAWHAFAGIGACERLQPMPWLEKTERYVMVIAPPDYGSDYVGEYITIYAENGVVCAHFKGDAVWYRMEKDWKACCREIAKSERI